MLERKTNQEQDQATADQNAGRMARQAPTHPERKHEDALSRIHGFDGDNYANPASNNADKSRAAARRSASAGGDADNDPVADMNAPEAIESIGRMRSAEKLQQIIDSDPRSSVKAAAQERLAALSAT